MNIDIVFDLIGLVGVIGYVTSYSLLQLRREFAKSFYFSFTNFCSAICMGISLMHDYNMPSFSFQAVMATLSLYGIYRCLKYSHFN